MKVILYIFMNTMIIRNYYRYNLINSNLSRISLKNQLFKTFTINNYSTINDINDNNYHSNSKSKSLKKENNENNKIKKNNKRTRMEPENIDINDINFSDLFWNNQSKWKDSK